MKDTVTIINNKTNQSCDFDILTPTRGVDIFDISKLYANMNLFTYDVGYTSTASCSSDITFIDGAKGELRYRGIDIETLAYDYNYLEVCYLLLNSKLPIFLLNLYPFIGTNLTRINPSFCQFFSRLMALLLASICRASLLNPLSL